MPRSFAAIKLERSTVIAALSSVASIPNGQEQLIYALMTLPYKRNMTYYFVSGNHLGLETPDLARQILHQAEFDRLFTYKESGKAYWFPATLKETDKRSDPVKVSKSARKDDPDEDEWLYR